MTTRLARIVLAGALAVSPVCAWMPAPAFAQPAASDAAKREARDLADKGYEHYEAGEYAKAIPFFRDAEARFHAPSLLLMQANSHVKLGQLVEAQPLYQRIVDEQLPADSPQEYRDAQTEAKSTLATITPRICTLKIVLKGMSPDRVKVTIDDVEVPPDRVLQPIPANPGTHKIVATLGGDEGGRAVYQSVTLKDGITKQIQLVFRPGDPATPTPQSGGCASCEVGSARGPAGGAGATPGVLFILAVASLLSARRR